MNRFSYPSTDPPVAFNRRDFLALAGSVGAWSILTPGLDRVLRGVDLPIPTLPIARDSGLAWRMLGPFRGGRVDAVAGVPGAGRSNEFYFGAVNGGVWKTIDGGRVWKPIFDTQPVASIGAMAVAPSAPDVLYAGSGESTLRDSVGYGNGMYKSNRAGRARAHNGPDETPHHRQNPPQPPQPHARFVG